VAELLIAREGVRLSGERTGEGVPVVLLHGLTATRRYVVMGSSALERSGHSVISYDARGHGRSSPAPEPSAYTYEELSLDLQTVLDQLGLAQIVVAGASMGAHTALAFALARPDRVAGVVVITPAYEPAANDDPQRLARWDALAEGLRSGGVDGFVAAYGTPRVGERWREAALRVIRQRMALHEHPEAVADALHAVPRSRPFEDFDQLAELPDVPVTVVISDDEADPEHPRAVGEAYVRAIPRARAVTDAPGRSPIAWQGSQLSKVIAEVTRDAKLTA
jgi:pimeloyl-ACP methyl ester carboxylesterase